jgi:hypothetical protein
MPQNPLIKFEYVVKNMSSDPNDLDFATASPVINYANHTQFEDPRYQAAIKTDVAQASQIEIWQHGPR